MLAGKITPISAELGYEPYIATEFPNTFPPLIFTYWLLFLTSDSHPDYVQYLVPYFNFTYFASPDGEGAWSYSYSLVQTILKNKCGMSHV